MAIRLSSAPVYHCSYYYYYYYYY